MQHLLQNNSNKRVILEICDKKHGTATFDSLYAYFDEFIKLLQTNPVWTQKLYTAKERFIRSKDRNYYSTDFFGFYDESEREGRSQISFYYSIHFHEFMSSHYPEFTQVPEILRFFEACYEIQKPYGDVIESKAPVIADADRKLIRIGLIRINLRSLAVDDLSELSRS